MDKIFIRDLDCQCVLGVYDEERHKPRKVLISLVIYHHPIPNDDFNQAVDYDTLSQSVTAHVRSTRFKLIESLANSIAEKVLQTPKVLACRVTVDKHVPIGADSVAAEVFRQQP